jgi:hypothetical protein
MSSIREDLAINLVEVLKEIEDDKPILVTREPFNVEELAITQFPAILVQTGTEDRELLTMGAPGTGRKQGTINYSIRGFVRGNELDSKRNRLIEQIEEILDTDRQREKTKYVVMDSIITSIEIIERQPPLAEFVCNYEITYNYLVGTN